MEHAVDAEPDAQVLLGRLDVDVGRAVGDGLRDQQVDELDDRRVLDDLADVREVVAVVELVGGLLRHRVDFAVEAVEAVDRVLQLTRGRDDGEDVRAGERADVVDREHVRRVAHRDDEPAVVVPADRQRLVLAGEVLGDEAGDRRVDRALGEVDELEADLLGERADEVGLGDVAELDQDPAERLAARRLLGAGPRRAAPG